MKLETEQGISPDCWIILEIKQRYGIRHQKILAGWGGSYLYGDSWRMSSPIAELDIKINSKWITAVTESGSTITCLNNVKGCV